MLRIALVQMLCQKGAVDANLAATTAAIDAASERGVDLICFPEMSITGYIMPPAQPGAVLTLDGPEVARFVATTRNLTITAVAGIVEHNPSGKPFITALVARGGSLLGVYRKRTIAPDELPYFDPGAALPIFTVGGTPFGVTICADINTPDLFAAYAHHGAQLVVECAAPGLYGPQATRNWSTGYAWWHDECHAKLGKYARENGITIAVATQAGRTIDEDFPGGGYMFGPDGRCLTQSGDWFPGVLYADIDLPRSDVDHHPAEHATLPYAG